MITGRPTRSQSKRRTIYVPDVQQKTTGSKNRPLKRVKFEWNAHLELPYRSVLFFIFEVILYSSIMWYFLGDDWPLIKKEATKRLPSVYYYFQSFYEGW